jgi:hypothetical protein
MFVAVGYPHRGRDWNFLLSGKPDVSRTGKVFSEFEMIMENPEY